MTALNRREFLQCAALLSAGASALSTLPAGWSMTEQQTQLLRDNSNFLDSHTATLFTADQRLDVAAVARQIIPTTDTPGADEANVSQFIELMVEHWFTREERTFFLTGFAALNSQAGCAFHQCSENEQVTVLETLEEEASGSSWFKPGNTLRTWPSDAPFICQIKELTVLGFMLSEVGATQFLRPNPMGQFIGELPQDDNTTAYAPDIPIRVMSKGFI